MKNRLLLILYIIVLCCPLYAQLSLDSCLKLAVQNNKQLRVTQLEIEKAKLVKAQALTKYFPQVKAVSGGFYALNPMFIYGIQNIENADIRAILQQWFDSYGYEAGVKSELELFKKGIGASVSALQPIYAGGQIYNGNRLAKLSIEAQQLQADIAKREMLEQVESTYWLLYSLILKQQTLTSACALLDTLDTNISIAQKAGLALAGDNLKLQFRRNELENKRLQLSNGITLAGQALAQLIGTDSVSIDTTSVHIDTIGMVATAREREELRLLELQLTAAKLTKLIDLGKALPQVAAGAAYTYSNLVGQNRHNGLVFFTVQIPLTQWWETSHKLKEHDINIRQAELRQQYLSEQLELQDRQNLFTLAEAADRLQRCQSGIALAQENYRVTKVNYDAGLQTMSELLESQTMLLEARNQQVDIFISYCIALRKCRALPTM